MCACTGTVVVVNRPRVFNTYSRYQGSSTTPCWYFTYHACPYRRERGLQCYWDFNARPQSDQDPFGLATGMCLRPPSRSPCFPAAATVVLEHGQTVPINSLRAGDRIMATDAAGRVTADTVSSFSLADPSATNRVFVELRTDAGHTLRLTPDHHLPIGPVCCSELKRAGDVLVGDVAWWSPANSTRAAAQPQRVLHAALTLDEGLFSPVLRCGGYPIVDRFVTSFDSEGRVRLAAYALPLADALPPALNALTRGLTSALKCTAAATALLGEHTPPCLPEVTFVDGLTVDASGVVAWGGSAIASCALAVALAAVSLAHARK